MELLCTSSRRPVSIGGGSNNLLFPDPVLDPLVDSPDPVLPFLTCGDPAGGGITSVEAKGIWEAQDGRACR